MRPFTLEDFVRESNRIERIVRKPRPSEMEAHERFLAVKHPTVSDLGAFIWIIQPSPSWAPRRKNGLRLGSGPEWNVSVGGHDAPRGGPHIQAQLEDVLRIYTPYQQHVAYELLHPFLDGNGRSGRVLWLHTMGGIDKAPLGFLNHFYYQALSQARR